MKDGTAWYCIEIYKIYFSFQWHWQQGTLFHYTGQKIKIYDIFKNSNKHILTERLNDMMNQKEFDSPSVYYDYEKFNEDFGQNIYNGTNILHINIDSVSYHFDDFHTLLSQLFVNFDIIGIKEARLKTHALRTTNINLQG